MSDLAAAIPVLPSMSIAKTEAFYRNWLGFHDRIYRANDYLIVRRHHIELHFWLTKAQALPKNSSVYMRGGEVPELFAEYHEREIQGLSQLIVLRWKLKEFYLHDLHGNLLRFGCAPEKLRH